MDISFYLQIFTALIAIMNPISAVPLYLAFTENVASKRTQIARQTSLSVMIISTVTLLLGQHILELFGISVDALRMAGGILLLFMSFNMLQAQVGRVKSTPEEKEEAVDSETVAVVPLALPLLAGPGAISTIILFANEAESAFETFALFVVLGVISLVIWLVLHLAPQIGKRMSRTAMNILTRVMGLILAAIAIEFIFGGLRGLLPILAVPA